MQLSNYFCLSLSSGINKTVLVGSSRYIGVSLHSFVRPPARREKKGFLSFFFSSSSLLGQITRLLFERS
jgi:hypothetical protein